MNWYLTCANPQIPSRPLTFPFSVGRTGCDLDVDDPSVARAQFHLETRRKVLFVVNDSMTNPTVVDGTAVSGAMPLAITGPHVITCGTLTLVVSPNKGIPANSDLLQPPKAQYCFETDGVTYGPVDDTGLTDAFANGTFRQDSLIWNKATPEDVHPASDFVDFGTPQTAATPDVQPQSAFPGMETPSPFPDYGRGVTAEEVAPEQGTNFMCPYCRAVPNLEDVLSVSVSDSLLGDPVLGPAAQQRFLPSRFTQNGLAIDAAGGVCTDIACPRCHMSLPQQLLDIPQIVMSVVGAPSAGKSFFLASAIWQCRQLLSRRFGVSFMDLDPVANRWINEYEEKLFFESGDDSLRKIDKTDVGQSAVLKEVVIDGSPVQLPLPSFFKLRANDTDSALVVYDSAGEHFQAGFDTSHSLVTRNILGADVLYFLYDPSADPRFRSILDRGTGTASRGAQRQDTLLAEMAARIQRHLGNRREAKVTRPLVIGVSKADMLRNELPLDRDPYREIGMGPNGKPRFALDYDVLRSVSEATETLLGDFAPESVATAHDIADEVWFLPMSSLGHNPMQEGVRPSEVHPIWAELPIVFTLARKGLVETVGESPA